MTEERLPAWAILVSLPRPQRPLPPRKVEKGRFDSLEAMVNDAWKDDEIPPRHAWIRYSLSAGVPLAGFIEAFQGLSQIKRAFGRRVFVHPVRMDHHEVDLADFDQMANSETGQYEVEVRWRKKRCDGGSHMFFAVESFADETVRDHSAGLDALNALEELVRITLGAMTVVQTRRTFHLDLVSRHIQEEEPRLSVYGPAEIPRSDHASISDAIELAERSATLPAATIGRLSLGLRWANLAFKEHDLLAYWTAIEILADRTGHAVYSVFAQAYGHAPAKAQTVAKALGLDVICKLRASLVHDGLPMYVAPAGASFLNALVHDVARHAAGLPCRRFAQGALGSHRVEEWLRRDATAE